MGNNQVNIYSIGRNNNQPQNLLDAALQYAGWGWPVLPLQPRGKLPLTGHGSKDATTDAATIRGWWARWPDANVGIATGGAAGPCVVDLDVDDGKDGPREWAELIAANGPVETAAVATGGGGLQLYFLPDPGFRNSQSRLAHGIDTRGAGGYVVAVPSIHPSGRAYSWAAHPETAGIAPLPDWLAPGNLAGMVDPTATPSKASRATPDASERCRLYLETVPDAVSGSGGHNATYRAACEAFRFGLTESQAWDALSWFNATKCHPAWTERELRHKLAQGRAQVDREGRFGARLTEGGWDADWPATMPIDTPPAPIVVAGAGQIRAGPILRRFSDIEPTDVQWLWPNRIALGKLTLICGDPGLGKSFTTLDMAARVSTGSPWPDGAPCPKGEAILISAEDDPSDTIRPRLDRAGADVRNIVDLPGVIAVGRDGEAAEKGFTLENVPALREALERMADCKLVVIDPVSAYLNDKDSHKNSEIRGLLAPLAQLAAERGVAVVMVTHLSKSGGARAMYRAMGSMAFVAACRSAWLIAKDNDNPRRRMFLPIKNNIGNDDSGLAYTIIDGAVSWEREAVTIKADDALAAEADQESRPGPDPECRDEAKRFLQEALAASSLPASDVYAQAKDAGISKRTVDRAKKELGVKARKVGMSGSWVWELPSAATSALIDNRSAALFGVISTN